MSALGFFVRQARNALRERRKALGWRAFQARNPLEPDACGLIASFGIGDHLIVCGMAEAVQRASGLRVRVAGNPRYGFIGGLFPAVSGYVGWPTDLAGEEFGSPRIEGGCYYYAHFPGMELLRAIGCGPFHLLDAYRCRLGLPASARISPARLPSPPEVAAARSELAANGLPPGRTVILAIDAGTTPTDGVEPGFWRRLAAELKAGGLEAVVNVGPTTEVPQGLRGLAWPLERLRAAVEAAGGVCSIRSGLSDLVCDLKAARAVAYPDVRFYAGPLISGTTFARFGLADPPVEVDLRSRGLSEAAVAISRHFLR